MKIVRRQQLMHRINRRTGRHPSVRRAYPINGVLLQILPGPLYGLLGQLGICLISKQPVGFLLLPEKQALADIEAWAEVRDAL